MNSFLASVVKYSLFITNVAGFFMGLVLLGFGIFAEVTNGDLRKLIENDTFSITIYSSVPVILIIVSCFIVLVSFLGCCGAIKENRFLIFLYFILQLLVFTVVVIGCVMASSQSLNQIEKPLLSSLKKYNPNATDPAVKELTESWDSIQTDFKCCGVDSFHDWKNVSNLYPDAKGHLVPTSCCNSKSSSALEDCRLHPEKYKDRVDGCLTKLKQSILDHEDKIVIVTGAIIALLFVNLVILFAFGLCLTPRNAYQSV